MPGQFWVTPAIGVLVPAADTWRTPGGLEVLRVNEFVISVVDIPFGGHRRVIVFQKQLQAPHHVAHFAFREKDDAAAHDDVRVGAIEHEQIGEPRDGDALKGARPVAPFFTEFSAILTNKGHRPKELIRVKPGAIDDHIDRVLGVILGDNSWSRLFQ